MRFPVVLVGGKGGDFWKKSNYNSLPHVFFFLSNHLTFPQGPPQQLSHTDPLKNRNGGRVIRSIMHSARNLILKNLQKIGGYFQVKKIKKNQKYRFFRRIFKKKNPPIKTLRHGQFFFRWGDYFLSTATFSFRPLKLRFPTARRLEYAYQYIFLMSNMA
jgi:hypothetical protein